MATSSPASATLITPLTSPESSIEVITAYILANPPAARSARVEDKVRIIGKMKEEAGGHEDQLGGLINKVTGANTSIRERCVESQMAAAVLLESTLNDRVERKAILDQCPGLRSWLSERIDAFTNPRLRAIVEQAISQ